MAQNRKLSINESWEILFNTHNIIEQVQTNGFFKITATEINKIREARLMAKFDQSSQLPAIFKSNNLSILPITRGEYIIGQYQTHFPVSYSKIKPLQVENPNLVTLDSNNLYSESSALLFAYNSGIIKDIINADKINYTVNGRMKSGEFSYKINNILDPNKSQTISVKNAQVEIDGGYESPDCFCICEAKNIAAEELLIRQLYYPYRLWTSKISKPVIPIFFVYSNDMFHAFIYKFEEINNYNSIKLIEQKSYTFADEDISLNELVEIAYSVILNEPNVTFPQADSFERILDLLSILFEQDLSRDEVTYKYEFKDRQTNYYIDACIYLGLVRKYRSEEKEVMYTLTENARKIMQLRYKSKYLSLIKIILERPVFNKIFKMTIENLKIPEKKIICRIMSKENFKKPINQTTIDRRASTVRGWIEWLLRLIN